MHQKLKHIFAVLNGKYNIMVKDTDFAAKGTFRARLANIWGSEREKNPRFGQPKGMSEICIDDVDLVYQGLADGKLRPYKNPFKLKLVIMFCLLRFFGLRTVEAAHLEMENVRFGEYAIGPDKGSRYVELVVDIRKVRKMKLGQWKVPKDYGRIKVRDNPDDDVFNVFHLFEFYLSKVPNREGR